MIQSNEPQNCQDCGKSLERGYSTCYKGDQITKFICFACDRELSFREYLVSRRLSIRLLMDVLMDLHYTFQMSFQQIDDLLYCQDRFNRTTHLEDLKNKLEIQIASLKIIDKIKDFEKKVWFDGLQKMAQSAKTKGISAKTQVFDNFAILTYTMSGRTMITIQNNGNSITLITGEDSSECRMGLQGIDATFEKAYLLLDIAIQAFQKQLLCEGKKVALDFQEDRKVSMGF
jgi:hypothetical protein